MKIITFSPDEMVVNWTGFWFSFVPAVEKTCRRGLCCFFVVIVVSVALFKFVTVTLFLFTGANNVELNRLANNTELRVTERFFFGLESVFIWLVDSVWEVVVPEIIEEDLCENEKMENFTLNFFLFQCETFLKHWTMLTDII